MKTKSYFFFAAISLLTLAACNFTDDNEVTANDQPSEQVPVTLSAQISDLTRANADSSLNYENIANNSNVTVRISAANAASYTDYVYTTTATAGELALPASPRYYPTNGDALDIIAYHPAKTNAAFTLDNDQPTDFTVANDQTTAANYVASDLMWSNGVSGVTKTNVAQPLVFAHKLCKVYVKATGYGSVTKIHRIRLMQVKPTVTFDPDDGTVELDNEASTTPVILFNEDETGSGTLTEEGVAIIPAQTITGNLIEIVYSDGGTPTATAYYKVELGKTFVASKIYYFTLQVSEWEVKGSNTVTDWGEGTADSQKIYTELGS